MITKVHGGWLHTGLGHKKDSVYPLPRWSTYEKRNRNEPGSYNDIYHYMNFCQDNYQTAGITDLTGDEIADTICKLYGTDSYTELDKLNTAVKNDFDSWSELYDTIKQIKLKQTIDYLSK